MDPANEIMGGRAKDILWELIPFMPKATSDFYSEALLRCKANLQLDKAFRGLEEILCVLVWLVGLFVNTDRKQKRAQRKKNRNTETEQLENDSQISNVIETYLHQMSHS